MIVSQLSIRACCLVKRSLQTFRPHTLPRCDPFIHKSNSSLLINQIRLAGHAKWQNIARTKLATDQAKAKMISRYVLLVRRAIVSNNMQADPKLNGKLADVLTEAGKMNVPKATLDRAIARAVNVKIISCNLEIQGPGGSAIVARCETDSTPNLRRDIKKILKKHESNLMPDDSIVTMFHSRGFIRCATKTKDGRDIDAEFAEEAAIMSNAEDFELEEYDAATDDSLAKVWVFRTDANTINHCRGDLEKLGFKVTSSDLELVPYRAIDFGEDCYTRIVDLTTALAEHEQVIDVFHNALPPKEES
jgi:transcriptional/translational regulatory protein YebC/TACO1